MTTAEAKNKLEGFKLARFKINKSGHATEQDPMPIVDPITGKGFEMKLGKEYLMPSYMEGPLRSCYRPHYETYRDSDGNATRDHKSKAEIYMNVQVNGLTTPKEKYLEEHPETSYLFSVDEKLRKSVEAQTGSKKPAAKTAEKAEKADFQ